MCTHGPETLQQYLQHINQAHPSIKFTIETTEDSGSIPFLDSKITVEPSGKYTTELYIKPTSAGIILHAESAQPWKTKKGVLHSQIRRAIQLSSDEHARTRSISRIKELFLNNGYSSRTINEAVNTCMTRRRQSNATRQRSEVTRMVLPFISDQLSSAVAAAIRGSGQLGVGVTWTNDNTIRRHLVRSALKPPACPGGRRCHACAAGLQGRCHSSGVVYELTCALCKKTYIGESGRMVRLRYNEHLRDAKNQRRDSPWGDHFSIDHPNSLPNPKSITVRILQVCTNERERKIAESLHIRDRRPALNTNIASWAII